MNNTSASVLILVIGLLIVAAVLVGIAIITRRTDRPAPDEPEPDLASHADDAITLTAQHSQLFTAAEVLSAIRPPESSRPYAPAAPVGALFLVLCSERCGWPANCSECQRRYVFGSGGKTSRRMTMHTFATAGGPCEPVLATAPDACKSRSRAPASRVTGPLPAVPGIRAGGYAERSVDRRERGGRAGRRQQNRSGSNGPLSGGSVGPRRIVDVVTTITRSFRRRSRRAAFLPARILAIS